MLDGLTPDLAPRLVLAIGGVGVALVILVLVLIFLKRRNSPLFIKGGKSREPRLLVLDAAAVDPKRRLVLIRRDEVEHLIMIGGPTDIVIESGITDRARPAAASRAAVVEDAVQPRAVSVATPEVRQPPPAERKPEPVRPAAPVSPEKPLAAPAEARVAQPAMRAATAPAQASDKVTPAAERLVERPPVERREADRQPDAKGVSAMGAMLYNEDRAPVTGARPASTAAAERIIQTPPLRSEPAVVPAAEKRIEPGASAAEAALEAARNRVLHSQQPAAGQRTTSAEAEKSFAAPLETARMDAMRRVQSAQPAVSDMAQPVVQPAAARTESEAEPPKTKDAEPSDFEKLLEAELDASGVFGGQPPEVRGDTRVTHAMPAGGVVPPVRVTPPITGATPDVSSEEEVARRLGEIAVNRRP